MVDGYRKWPEEQYWACLYIPRPAGEVLKVPMGVNNQKWVSRQNTRFAENIAVLSVLNPFPLPPSTNPIPTLANGKGPVRILSFERESSLVSGLAFLAGVSDNPNHVVALCLEELPGKDGLKALLAINKAQPGDSEEVLATTKRGLQEIFEVLSRVRYDSDGRKLECEVLQAVVRLSRTRILQRIGSKQTKQGSKRFVQLGSTLKQVTAVVADRTQQGTIKSSHRETAQRFIQISNALQVILKELENCTPQDVDRKLQQIVSTANRLDGVAHLPSLLINVPAKPLDPNTLDGLSRRLGKLAQYYGFSRYLYQTAKNTRLFRRAEVKSVSLQPSCFVKLQMSPSTYSLGACLARCQQSKGAKSQLCQKLGKTVAEANDAINNIAAKTINDSKIHAEIQILAHYELNPTKLPPRVISSNKDACFLCNELIKLHGKFYTPGSHGRLWPGWKLPALTVYDPLWDKLNQVLESWITSLCQQILASPKKQAIGPPNESTVFAFSTSMSTILSLPESSPGLPIQVVKPSNAEGPRPVCDQTSSGDRAGSSTTEQPAEAVAPERSKSKRMDSGYVSMSSTGSGHGPDQPNICAQSILETDGKEPTSDPTSDPTPELTSEPSKGPSSHSDEGVGNNTSSVNFPSVKGEEITEEVTPLISVGGSRSGELPAEEHIAYAKGKGRQPASVYDDIPLVSLPVEETPSRSSVVVLRKGVVVKCRFTDYTSFLAGNLSIIPECIRSSRSTPECKLRVEWLEDGHNTAPVTDVWTLSDVVETYTPDSFLLRHGDIVVKVDVIKS